MKPKDWTRFAYGVVALGVALVGCTSSGPSPARLEPSRADVARGYTQAQSPRSRSTLVTNSALTPVHPDRGASRMSPNLVKAKLLYVSDPATDDVQVYTFPQGVQLGTLTGFNQPQGECVDKSGDIYVTNTQASNIVEFAFGGTTPINTLADPGQYPVACSVNPRTGDVAVSNAFDSGFYHGSVSIYKLGSGTPTVYPATIFWQAFFLSYDGAGNIFLDGLSNDGYYRFLLAELPKGSSTFSPIAVDTTINYPGGVMWIANQLAIGDQEYAITQSAIYQVQVSGSTGTVAGTTLLNQTCDIVQFFIQKTRIVGPDACKANANEYPYPAGGAHVKVIKAGLKQPVGSAVSTQPTS